MSDESINKGSDGELTSADKTVLVSYRTLASPCSRQKVRQCRRAAKRRSDLRLLYLRLIHRSTVKEPLWPWAAMLH